MEPFIHRLKSRENENGEKCEMVAFKRHLAIQENNQREIQRFIPNVCDENADPWIYLKTACYQGNVHVVEQLFGQSSILRSMDQDWIATAKSIAKDCGHASLITYLDRKFYVPDACNEFMKRNPWNFRKNAPYVESIERGLFVRDFDSAEMRIARGLCVKLMNLLNAYHAAPFESLVARGKGERRVFGHEQWIRITVAPYCVGSSIAVHLEFVQQTEIKENISLEKFSTFLLELLLQSASYYTATRCFPSWFLFGGNQKLKTRVENELNTIRDEYAIRNAGQSGEKWKHRGGVLYYSSEDYMYIPDLALEHCFVVNFEFSGATWKARPLITPSTLQKIEIEKNEVKDDVLQWFRTKSPALRTDVPLKRHQYLFHPNASALRNHVYWTIGQSAAWSAQMDGEKQEWIIADYDWWKAAIAKLPHFRTPSTSLFMPDLDTYKDRFLAEFGPGDRTPGTIDTSVPGNFQACLLIVLDGAARDDKNWCIATGSSTHLNFPSTILKRFNIRSFCPIPGHSAENAAWNSYYKGWEQWVEPWPNKLT
jgi:hypothetical protein